MNYAYILRCSDGSLYCGWTNDLNKRVAAHNSGKGSKYTRSRLPVQLAYYESFDTPEEAMSREWHLKRLTHREKEALIKTAPSPLLSAPLPPEAPAEQPSSSG
ncbi:MAG: GIY-YIG nuclease family protein [Lachnospiraceae bacterium]|nr:GIY-YIG nuclease family protein [Lachnospiraceae bacterium]